MNVVFSKDNSKFLNFTQESYFSKDDFSHENHPSKRQFDINPYFKLISIETCLAKNYKKKKKAFFGKFGLRLSAFNTPLNDSFMLFKKINKFKLCAHIKKNTNNHN